MGPTRPTRPRFPLAARIIVAMIVGGLTGLALGRHAEPLGQLGAVLIDLIKGLAAPLLLFAVLDAFLRTQVKARSGLIMVGISLCNAALALAIGLTLSNTLRPGEHLAIPSTTVSQKLAREFAERARAIDFIKELAGYLPTSVARPFVDNAIITIVILAVLGGAALRRVKDEQLRRGETGYRAMEDFIAMAYRAIEVMLGWVIALVPLAVFGVVARTIGLHGFSPLRGLAVYVGVAVLGLVLQIVIVYQGWLVLVARMSLVRFWAGARDAVVYALGASSSLATLPVTLRCLDRLRVSPQAARLAACVGTNLNNDGILLYEAMAVLFVAQVYGIHLSLGQQLLTAAACAIAGIGIGGVPDAGLISLSLVLATVGLPVELLPLLLTVDWILSRCRAVTNVISDLLVAVLLDRFEAEETDRASQPACITDGATIVKAAGIGAVANDPDGI
ncbi:MAG: dicarboxylate/amino acid:cation symporter [Isosphaeraceae bacterium]|nr:dicarboxylate/amino acid:cation symporter [Isosphaeraceae bacterium]